jgi:uncharacterized protein YxeA
VAEFITEINKDLDLINIAVKIIIMMIIIIIIIIIIRRIIIIIQLNSLFIYVLSSTAGCQLQSQHGKQIQQTEQNTHKKTGQGKSNKNKYNNNVTC